MAQRPQNKDQMKAYREGVWARREGQSLGGGNKNGGKKGGGGNGGGGGLYFLLTMLRTVLVGLAVVLKRDDGWDCYKSKKKDGNGGGGLYFLMTMTRVVLTGLTATLGGPAEHANRRPGDRNYFAWHLTGTVWEGLVTMRRSGPLGRSPKAISLAFIDWYQSEVSAGRNACPTGHIETHCSAYGREAIERHGALVGWLRTAGRVNRCRKAQGFRVAW